MMVEVLTTVTEALRPRIAVAEVRCGTVPAGRNFTRNIEAANGRAIPEQDGQFALRWPPPVVVAEILLRVKLLGVIRRFVERVSKRRIGGRRGHGVSRVNSGANHPALRP